MEDQPKPNAPRTGTKHRRIGNKPESAYAEIRGMLERISDGFLSLDRKWRFTFINDTGAKLIGVKKEGIIGKVVWDIYPDAVNRKFRSEYYRAVETGSPVHFEEFYPEPLNAWFECHAYPSPDGLSVFYRDITRRKRSEELLLRYRMLAENSRDIILFLDFESGRILEANTAAVKAYGYSREELLQLSIHDVRTPAKDVLLKEQMATANAGGILFETAHVRRDGSIFPVEVSSRGETIGNARTLISVIRDITERKHSETLLRVRSNLQEFATSHSIDEFLQNALDEISALTDSSIAFLHFVDDDQENMQLLAWSTRTLTEFCTAEGKGMHYPVLEAGVWLDCMRERRAVVHNDFAALTHRKGFPQGHPPLIRELVVPIMRGEKIVAVLGVGNKPCDYTSADVELTWYLGDVAWAIAARTKLQEELRRSHAELELRVQERTAELRESEERLRHLSGRLLTTQEEERKRIGAEIHDSIGSSLASVKFSLELERARAKQENRDDVIDLLDRLIPITQSAIDETRRIHTGMRPPVLDDFGLIVTISWFCREFEKSYPQIHIEQVISVKESEIPEPLKIVIFRIIQEAFNNIAKHSMAEFVDLAVRGAGESIELAIEDHGAGFDINGVLSREDCSRGLGLASMKERASLAGGKLIIDSTPGEGTIIKGTWSIDRGTDSNPTIKKVP